MHNGKLICLGELRTESICSSALEMLKYTILFYKINRLTELDYTLLMQLTHTDGQDTEGGMGPAEGRGYLTVNDGQKGGRAWTVPEQSGWCDGGGGGREKGRSACVITREDKGLVSLQAADVAATEQAVTFCLYSVCIVLCM